jgi:hypothetical protein
MSDRPKKTACVRAADARSRDLHVVPHAGGWAIKQAGAASAARIYNTQQEAVEAARGALRTAGGGLRIHSRDGRIRDSFTLGRDAMSRISAVEGIHLTAEMQKDFREFDRQGLTDAERRRAIADKYGKRSA